MAVAYLRTSGSKRPTYKDRDGTLVPHPVRFITRHQMNAGALTNGRAWLSAVVHTCSCSHYSCVAACGTAAEMLQVWFLPRLLAVRMLAHVLSMTPSNQWIFLHGTCRASCSPRPPQLQLHRPQTHVSPPHN